MKRLWLCLAASLVIHALFFPSFLSALMDSAAVDEPAKTTPRVNIRLIAKPKPKPPVAKPKPKPPVVKPKPKPPVAKPKPKPPVVKPKPKPPVVKPKPKPPVAKPKPVAPAYPQSKPRPKPPVAPKYPQSKPKPVAQNTPKRSAAKGKPDQRPVAPPKGRLVSTTSKTNSQARTVTKPASSDGRAARPGEVPGYDQQGSPSAPEGQTGAADGTGVPGSGGDSPAPPEPAPPAPVEAPAPPPPPAKEPEPPKERKKVPTSAPQARKATIEVPHIRLPASLRKKTFKGSLQLRAVVDPSGSATFNLNGSCGNEDVDDYVLDQVRKVAIVSPALDENGTAKKSVVRVRVSIEVD